MVNEYYCGLPQQVWDCLCTEAEDLLYSQGLGNHLVGLYPAGNRIYGIESSPPGLLCLYVDSVESILDPHYSPEVHEYNVGNMMSPITMIELHHWVQRILDQGANAIIPCYSMDVVYQEDGVDSVLEAARDCLKAFGYPGHGKYPERVWYWRARLVLLATGEFHPCANPEWGRMARLESIFPGNHELCRLDRHMTFSMSQQLTVDIEVYDRYMELLASETKKFVPKAICTTPKCMAAKDKLSKEIINFYRFML